jgi:hypothetical protein
VNELFNDTCSVKLVAPPLADQLNVGVNNNPVAPFTGDDKNGEVGAAVVIFQTVDHPDVPSMLVAATLQ